MSIDSLAFQKMVPGTLHVIRKAFLAGLFIFSAGCVLAQDLEYVREVIATLGSDKMRGRGYVRNGDGRAAAYVRNEFINIGLIPLTPDYYQPFHVTVNTFPSTMELALNGKSLIPNVDFIAAPSSPGIKGEYGLEIIAAKDLLDNDSLVLNRDMKDLFIVIDNRHSDDLDAMEKDALKKKMEWMQDNPFTDAAGFLELLQEKPAWGVANHVSLKSWFIVNYPVDPDTLVSITVRLSNRFKEHYVTRNVAGYITGTQYPDSFLVFTAHYDHLGLMGKKILFPGANDNASGVAMLLYLARYFKMNPPPFSVVFLSFSAEELGLLGSSYFVRHSPIDLSRIRFLVNFDMVGTGGKGIKVVNGTLYTREFEMLKEINEEDHCIPAIVERTPSCISDHCPFDYRNVPGFYIYTEGEPTEYHSVNDRLDEISLKGFEGLARMMTVFADSL